MELSRISTFLWDLGVRSPTGADFMVSHPRSSRRWAPDSSLASSTVPTMTPGWPSCWACRFVPGSSGPLYAHSTDFPKTPISSTPCHTKKRIWTNPKALRGQGNWYVEGSPSSAEIHGNADFRTAHFSSRKKSDTGDYIPTPSLNRLTAVEVTWLLWTSLSQSTKLGRTIPPLQDCCENETKRHSCSAW